MNENNSFLRSLDYVTNNHYSNGVCQWNLTVPEGKEIYIKLHSLITDPKRNYMTIFDGPNIGSHLIGNYSGQHQDVWIVSSSNQVLIQLKIDKIAPKMGFELNYYPVYKSSILFLVLIY